MAVIALHGPRVAGIRLAQLPPLGLYVHIPWCARKCPYCDFNSHEARNGVPEVEYIRALITDLEQSLPLVWGRRVYSIFFGGGTPSLLSAPAIDVLLSAFRARLMLAADCEITLEANPGTFEADKFRDFRAAGVNRLSIGVQSFNRRHLRSLGRIHDDRDARRAIETARREYDEVNLDLMYALPGQTPEESEVDVRTALSFGASHLSFYHLTIEPNTSFFRHPPEVPDDDTAAAMQALIEARLAEAGYVHYETSAYAKQGRECRHNVNYWRFGDYLGIGAGAHSKLSFPDGILRQMRYKQPREYMKRVGAADPLQEEHEIKREDAAFEFMMNALRLTEGFAVPLFAERTGQPITAVEKPLAQAEARGLILRDHGRIRPTELGRRFLNDLLQMFLPEERKA